MASSCQFGLLLVASIGLLMIVPHFGSALECYVENLPKSLVGRDAVEMNKFMVTANQQSLGMPNGEQKTMQCPAGVTHCATMRCNKMVKSCFELAPGYTPEYVCTQARAYCQDPNFYCRICNTDKCNNEPMNDANIGIGMQQ